MNTPRNIVVFLLMGAVFAAFGWFIVHNLQILLQQHRAESFPGTEGRVLFSDVTQHTGSKGRVHYRPDLLYTYEVNGQSYRGRRYRYDDYPSDYASVKQIVNAHPVGSEVNVYYNPDDPADTCLAPKVIAQDVSLPFLYAPIACLPLIFLFQAGRGINWPGNKPVAGGVKIMTRMMVTRVRLPRYQPGWLGLCTAGIVSTIAGLVIQFGHAASPVSAGLWGLIGLLCAGALAYFWQFQRLASGIQDLVIDEGARTFQLPLTYKRRERRPLPLSEIKAVTLEQVAHRGRYGVTYSYTPTLELQDGSSQRLTDLSEDRAEIFAAWLQEKLGLPAAK